MQKLLKTVLQVFGRRADGFERGENAWMLWARREDLEAMGKAVAVSIRELVPLNPVRLFTENSKSFVQNT
jgi:hypothetical protein